MSGLTAADFADTGQWRLIVKIFRTGMSAHLENTLHPQYPPQMLFQTDWEKDEETLLSHIENAVYDHPRVLDDFSAKIIVFDPNTLFIPTPFMEESEGMEEICYTTVYDVRPEDVMTDTFGDLTAVYSPAKGLKGFLNRTFPGAMVECNLMNQIRSRIREREGARMYVTPRLLESDFILFDGEELQSASTHPVEKHSDTVYHALNILDVYGIKPEEVEVILPSCHGGEEIKDFFSGLGTRCCLEKDKTMENN